MNKSTSKPGSPKLVPSVNFAHHSYVYARSRREEVALPDPIDGARWHAEITPNRVRINLGYYTEEIDAAKAYDQAALNHFGEFATLNFPVGAKG